jgi:hypothetical protein
MEQIKRTPIERLVYLDESGVQRITLLLLMVTA